MASVGDSPLGFSMPEISGHVTIRVIDVTQRFFLFSWFYVILELAIWRYSERNENYEWKIKGKETAVDRSEHDWAIYIVDAFDPDD